MKSAVGIYGISIGFHGFPDRAQVRHTVTNYQYRYGGTAIDVVRALYAEGGPRRFYRGHCDPPLSLCFFAKTALSCSFPRLTMQELP